MSSKRLLLTAAVLLAVACASGPQRPPDVTEPGVEARILNPLFFGATRTAAATFEIEVTNNAAVPMLVHSIRLSSPGMVEYSLRSEEKRFGETIGAGETRTFTMATNVVAQSVGADDTEPLHVRVDMNVEVNGRRYREIRNVLNVGK